MKKDWKKQWLSVAETADWLSVSDNRIKIAIARQELKAFNAGTPARAVWRIHVDDLEEYVRTKSNFNDQRKVSRKIPPAEVIEFI